MSNTKSLVFVITSLMFLVSAAICGQLLINFAHGAPPDFCFENQCLNRTCENNPFGVEGIAICCWSENPNNLDELTCQLCYANPDTGDFEDCTEPKTRMTSGPGVIAPPPSGVAPPPPTESCPENTARDAQGKCTPMTQGPQETTPGPEEITPTVDCTQNPNDPLCDTARIPESSPEALTPQVDCTQNPNDPQCETATIPEGEIDNETQGRLIGQPSPTGYCVPLRTPTCIPCDPGLPGSTCIPVSEWPPARTADTEISTQETAPQNQEDTSPEEEPARIPEGEIEEQRPQGEDTARIPEGEIEEPQQEDEDQSSEENGNN